MNFICLNGKFLPAGEAALHADNRGYRYGEALFETMKVSKGNIQLEVYHYERLFAGMQLLDFPAPPHFNREQITGKIKTLCEKNKCEELGRVRLSIFSGNGGLRSCIWARLL